MLLKKIQMHTVQESFQLLVILHCTTPHTRGICIVKWSWNFDWGTPSAIFGTPQVLKIRTLLEAVLPVEFLYDWSTDSKNPQS